MTKEEKMREIFYRFLKKQKAYRKFMRNLRNKKIDGIGSINDASARNYLSDAFTWEFSTERFEFWGRLERKWTMILKQIKFKPTKEVEEYRKFLGEN